MFRDEDAIYEYGLLCPMTMLHFYRVSSLARIFVKQPPNLMALISALADVEKKLGLPLLSLTLGG